MDWRIFKAIYDVSLHHHWVGTLFSDIEKASIPVMVVDHRGSVVPEPARRGSQVEARLSEAGSAAAALSYVAAF